MKLFAIALLALASTSVALACRSASCCTPSTCCNPGQFCPINLTPSLMQSGIVSFRR